MNNTYFHFKHNSKRLLIISIIAAWLFTSIPTIVSANTQIKGISLGEFSLGCDYYLIEDSYGDYSLVEWYGGTTPYSGDIVYGDLHSYGFKDLYDASIDQTTHVWLDDWMLSQDSASEKLIDKCGWDRNILNYFSNPYGTYSTPPTSNTISTCPVNSHENPQNTNKCLCDTGYEINAAKTACVLTVSCPVNSYASGNTCICNTGYLMLNNVCVTYNQSCQSTFGINSYGDKDFCHCTNGYQFNSTKTSCIATQTYKSPTITTGYTSIKKKASSSSSKSASSVPSTVSCKKSGITKSCQCPTGYKVSRDGSQCIRNTKSKL